MSKNHTPGARRVVPRSRGALSGFALIVLGLWGALIPFIGPYFNFSFTPDNAWHWTAARGWLEVLPGIATVVAGFLLLVGRSRTMTLVAAWLGIAAGAWFTVGPQLQGVWHIGSPGRPAGSSNGLRVLETLALFTLLGVVIVYFAATAFGRLSVVSLRDARAAERREAAAVAEAEREREREAAAAREREDAAAREREAAEAASARERQAAEAAAATDRSTDDVPQGDRTNATNSAHAVTPDGQQPAHGQPAYGQQQSGYSQAPASGYTQPDPEAAQPDPQVTQPDPQVTQTSTQADAQPVAQGYAQPQRYDPQHGYVQQAPAEPAESDTEPAGAGRRLFHRR